MDDVVYIGRRGHGRFLHFSSKENKEEGGLNDMDGKKWLWIALIAFVTGAAAWLRNHKREK